MDLEALGSSPLGHLVPISGNDARFGEFEYFAFNPFPLPSDVNLSSQTWTAVAEASTALGKLDFACTQLPDPRLLIRPALWREALDTSALEGTHGALRDLLEAQLDGTQFLSPEITEIRAYERVALMAFDLVKSRPISRGFLCELQMELLKDADKPPRDLGRLRQDQVWIGASDRPIQEARFVPVPPDDRLKAALDEWERWVQNPLANLSPVLRAAVTHYQFETIHPFGDGNGRIGRLVVVLQLLRDGVLNHPALTVSPWFLRRRSDYQNHLLQVSCTGDWNPWVQFFCRAVQEQSGSLISNTGLLLDWLRDARTEVNDRRWSGAIHRLVEDLIEWPIVTVAAVAARYDVTTMNAARMVKHLVEIDVLKEMTGRSYGRIFGATKVIEIVERMSA
ncbi:Fic family protein [Phytohabitans sp. ZYX-F-186]|uniref:Fic family protein n=1 Tax=Phytohabitans maris TaxID=3071409 RepID=A0ABU0ZN23_9ACTN|nr:Fic family protein [Phytohabitans sp. ZYX-F-186]MDQ7908363.1 Fic family protein [Phytohabitans sp. ZYX-F-186]